MTVFITLLLLFGNDPNDQKRLLKLTSEIGHAYSLAKLPSYRAEVESLLSRMTFDHNGFEHHFLSAIKSDIDTLARSEPSGNKNLANKIKNFSEGDYSDENPISHSRLNELRTIRADLTAVFGAYSFVDLFLTKQWLAYKVTSFRKQDLSEEISSEITRFENSKWKNSPFLCSLYLFHCTNAKNTGKFGLMYKNSLIAKERVVLLSGGESNSIILGPLSYEFESLVGLKRYNDVLFLFKTLPDDLLDSRERIDMAGASSIYSSLSCAQMHLGKLDHAAVNQELALAKIYQCVLSRNHPLVIDEAKKLQKILLIKKDYPELAKLEERYGLKPLEKVQENK